MNPFCWRAETNNSHSAINNNNIQDIHLPKMISDFCVVAVGGFSVGAPPTCRMLLIVFISIIILELLGLDPSQFDLDMSQGPWYLSSDFSTLLKLSSSLLSSFFPCGTFSIYFSDTVDSAARSCTWPAGYYLYEVCIYASLLNAILSSLFTLVICTSETVTLIDTFQQSKQALYWGTVYAVVSLMVCSYVD